MIFVFVSLAKNFTEGNHGESTHVLLLLVVLTAVDKIL